MAIIAAASSRVKDIMVILILRIMLSSGTSAIVQILQYLSDKEALKSFVVWTMGSLGGVTSSQAAILIPCAIVGILLAISVSKPLNVLLLGEEYANGSGYIADTMDNLPFDSPACGISDCLLRSSEFHRASRPSFCKNDFQDSGPPHPISWQYPVRHFHNACL